MPPFYENKTTEFRITPSRKLECGRHLHIHVEMVVVLSGHPTAILDNTPYPLAPGDAFLAFPNQIHAYRSTDEEHSLLAIFSPGCFADLAPLFAGRPPREPVVRGFLSDPALRALCEGLLVQHPDSLCEKARAKGQLLSLLASLLERFSLSPEPTEQDGDIFSSILQYCMQNYMNNLRLDDLASALHVCKFHISHLINGRMNMNFNDYLNSIRITQAADLLAAKELPITEISHRCGFNSTRTFNRAVRKQIGCAPREYRNGL